jgi:hypothetical protein
MGMMCLNALQGDKVGDLYQAIGYSPKEKTYIKRLGG